MSRSLFVLGVVLIFLSSVSSVGAKIVVSSEGEHWRIEEAGCDFAPIIQLLSPRLAPHKGLIGEVWDFVTVSGGAGSLYSIEFSDCKPTHAKKVSWWIDYGAMVEKVEGVYYDFSIVSGYKLITVESREPEYLKAKFLPIEVLFMLYRIPRAILDCYFEKGMTWSGTGYMLLSTRRSQDIPLLHSAEDVERLYLLVDVYTVNTGNSAEKCTVHSVHTVE